jgi:hypothetical protein
MDRTQVLKASTSILDVLGVSQESKEYVQKQMASILGIQDPNFYKEVEKLWQVAYTKKVTHDTCNREVFACEAIVNGLKYVKDDRFAKESEKLARLRAKLVDAEHEHVEAVAKAKAAQEEYLQGRAKS